MSKLADNVKIQLRYFFINEFWKRIPVLVLIILAIILNGLVWYFYLLKYRGIFDPTPIIYSSSVLILNVFLADISYSRQSLISYIFLGSSILIQILFLIYLKFVIFSQVF